MGVMKLKVCIDTNVLIAVKNRETGYEYCEEILDAVDERKLEGILSALVVAEVLVGFYKNNEEIEAKKFVTYVKHSYKIIPIDADVADVAARLRVKGLKLPDAIVAATSKLTDSILITKDKEMSIADVEVLTPEDFVEKHLK
jgi:predicted nucleic acid-binding protein